LIGSHIIPKFYLEQFSSASERGKNNPGRIWVYERGKVPHDRATSVQGKENGYFGYYKADGTLEESFEKVLADHEAECNEVLALSKFDTFPWQRGSREKLAFYAALLYSRATQRRTYSSKQWTKILAELREAASDDLLVKDIADAVARQLNLTTASESAVRKAIANYIQESDSPNEAKNSFLSGLIENTNLIAGLLLKKEPWRILRPPTRAEFVTTDNPLITFVPLGNGLLHPGYGFRKEMADAAFPLAPDGCLLMGRAWAVPRTLDAMMLKSLNDVFVTISDRYIYSKTRSDEVDVAVQKYAGDCRYGVNAFMPIGLKLPTARQFLRLHFGLEPEQEHT
jgi:hypothetical protein